MNNDHLEENTDMKTLEEQYREVFSPQRLDEIIPDNETLEQPSPLRNVDSFATYGVFEKPIIVQTK